MKNSIVLGALALLMALCFGVNTESQAQIGITPCQTYPIVAANCVGACGNPSTLSYTIPPLCSSLVQNLCLTNESSSLCPSYGAKAAIYVNGALAATGNITAVGSSISFQAPCGASVKVKVQASYIGGPLCVWLGNLNYALRLQ